MSVSPRSYLVCATPRSGSTLLCETLAATGVAGRPAEYFEAARATGLPRQPREYLAGMGDPELFATLPPLRWAPESAPPLAERVAGARREGTTPNGVFGAKVMWTHLEDLLAEAGHPADPAGELAERFGPLHYVHVRRRDVVAQAVSLWRAIQTDAWRAPEEPAEHQEPHYEFTAIDHLVRRLAAEDEAWRAWFSDAGVEPLSVVYEEVAADLDGSARRVLHHVGVPPDGVAIPSPPLRRQADERSAEWAGRYRAERESAA